VSDDRTAIEQLLRASKPGARHVVLHYLYFPAKTAALEVAGELRALGFKTEERLGADGTNWLVLARHEVVPSVEAITSTRRAMEDLTGSRGGEYDGWEAEVQH
jgi:hypothetical protein